MSELARPTGDRRTGGDALAELLRRRGVGAAFGVVSVHNLPLVDALARSLRWVPTRTEGGAVNAADGYARATDGLGCAVTSTGTGAGNAAGALVEALTAGSPVLHVTGQIDSSFLGQGRGVIHETRDQLSMLRATAKWAATAPFGGRDGPVGPAAELSAAAAIALGHPRGPVSVEWPIDRQYADPGPPPDDTIHPAIDGNGEPGDLEQAAERLGQARRPLVWLGGGARWARDEIGELLAVVQAGVLTSNAGRGVLPESTDERVIGNFATSPACADLLADADLLLSVGTHFRSNETRTYRLDLPRPHVQIDIDPDAIGRAYPADHGLVGPAGPVLRALAARIDRPRVDPEWAARIRNVRAECRAGLRADIGPHATICDALNQRLPPATNLVRDITIPNSAWGNRLLDVDDPTTNISPRGGGIGQALAMGIGAALGRPDRHTVVLIGDGGLQMQLGELATVRQERPDLTLVVFDDGGYGVIRNTQDAYVGRRSGVDLLTPDFGAVAAAHDLDCVRVERADAFADALATMVAAGGPGLIHVDCAKIGPMPVPFTPPVDVPDQR